MTTIPSGQIRNVSDTAWLVAALRAAESERPDRIIDDPFARLLVGDADELVREVAGEYDMSWFMAVRTAVLDAQIERAIAQEGVGTVVNLASGLDTRPYRLALPSDVTWFDVDLPPVVEFKKGRLAGVAPRCDLRFHAANLADPAARREVLAAVSAVGKKTLAITEGLLLYLTADDVGALADDLRTATHVDYWLLDLYHGRHWDSVGSEWREYMAQSNAPIRFAPKDGSGFFAPHGWGVDRRWHFLTEAERLGRQPPKVAPVDAQTGGKNRLGADFARIWDDAEMLRLVRQRH